MRRDLCIAEEARNAVVGDAGLTDDPVCGAADPGGETGRRILLLCRLVAGVTFIAVLLC